MRSLIYYIFPFILWHCAPKKPDPKNDNHDGSAPVIIIDKETISLNEFNRRIKALPEFASTRLKTVEAKRAHLPGVAQFEVLAHYAAKTGFAKDPEVISALKIALQKSEFQPVFNVSEEEVDSEMEKLQTEIRFGLIANQRDCSSDVQLNAMDRTKRFDAIVKEAIAADLSSFSTGSKGGSDHAILNAFEKVGDFKLLKTQNDRCRLILLTKIETQKIDRLKVEEDLRAAKKAAFLQTLEK